MPGWIPRQGDLVALDFDPQSGHEQKGRRRAISLFVKMQLHPSGFPVN